MRIDIKKAAEMLRGMDDVLILSHANPDGDTAGCAHALCEALQSMGKKSRILCSDDFSQRMAFMKSGVQPQDFEPKNIVSVDVADKKLLGALEETYGGRVNLAIDHHLSHVDFAEYAFVEPDAAAACETVYLVIRELGAEITDTMAACLYTGIATDTGCFKFSNVTPRTHRIAAELMEHDFGFAAINYTLFDMKTKSRLDAEAKVLSGMEYFYDSRCAVVVLTKEMLDSIDIEDTNGLASLPRQIEGVEVGVVIKEKKGFWKASLRTAETVDAQEICGRFGGGGHKRAAGCSFSCGIETAKKQLIEVIGEYLR